MSRKEEIDKFAEIEGNKYDTFRTAIRAGILLGAEWADTHRPTCETCRHIEGCYIYREAQRRCTTTGFGCNRYKEKGAHE